MIDTVRRMTNLSEHSRIHEVAWWQHETTPIRAPLTHHADTDVCVVGLGGSGIAAVRAARETGARVIGIDGDRIAGAAAGRNGGLLLGGLAPFHHDAAAQWGTAHATALYTHTLDELARMQRDSPEYTWWNGSLRIAETDEERDDCVRQQEQMERDGLPVSWYVGPEGEGLCFPNDGASHPVQRVHALAALAEREGAVLHEQSRVRAVQQGRVELANGVVVHAPIIVVCADGALGELLPEAAPLLRQVRLQMLATEPAHDVHLPRSVYARYGYDYWQQLPDHRIVFGGGRDQFLDAEYTTDDTPSADVQGWLEQRLRQCVDTSAAITHRWAATVSYTPDELPITREFHDGVWGVGGYCGTGNVVGALCGRGAVRRALGASDAFLDIFDAIRGERTAP